MVVDVLIDYAEERKQSGEVVDLDRISYAVQALTRFWLNRSISEINRATCKEYGSSREVSDGTVRRELGVLKAAISHDFKEGRLRDPVHVFLPKKPKAKTRWLTYDEYERLLESANALPKASQYLPLFIEIGVHTGARKRAILDLRWEQIDFKNNIIYFQHADDIETKKKKSTIPMPPELRGTLLKVKMKSAGADYVFGKKDFDIKKSFAKACKDAGIEGVTPHTLRHTTVTWLLQEGVPIREISGYVGLSEDMIHRVYGHHSPEWLQSSKTAIGNKIRKASRSKTSEDSELSSLNKA